jgi:hypothetical protein
MLCQEIMTSKKATKVSTSPGLSPLSDIQTKTKRRTRELTQI